MLEISNVFKTYRMGENVVHALRGVSLKIEDGDFVAIMGPSGSGKSTLMHLLGLLDTPTSGSYKINGREVAHLSEDELAVLRREEVGFIFQQFNLLPRMQALENVALPMYYSAPRPDYERAKELLNEVGLGSRLEHKTNELSGGQQQRVAIARALVNKPRVLFADEPTGNLDSASEKEIMGIIRRLNAEGITVVIVTHEEEIGEQAFRRIRMRDGQIQSDERLRPFPSRTVSASESQSGARSSDTQRGIGAWFRQNLEHFRQGFKTLASNKVRTALSMLGILIGVAAVVAMLAIGTGAQKAIESQLSSLGSNLLILRSGGRQIGGVMQEAGSTTRLSQDDVTALKEKIPMIHEVSPTVNGRGQVAYENKNWNTQILGASSSYARMHSLEPTVGRFFTDEENQKRARVAVIGATVLRELFGERNPIGEMIKINKVNFQVIGILPPKGATGWRDQDDVVAIPIQTAMHRLLGKDYVDSIEIEINSSENLDSAQDQILDFMYSRHKVPPSMKDDAYTIHNLADIQQALTQSSQTMSLLLSSIAAISLLVGGIGIMNIMLVSVTERTREVGLRKAIGARPSDILLQFLIESVVISAVGGACGILFGGLITFAVSSFLGWNTAISPTSVALAFLFSASVGVIFGIYPAKKAAALNPIEALRYE